MCFLCGGQVFFEKTTRPPHKLTHINYLKVETSFAKSEKHRSKNENYKKLYG